MAHKNKIFKTIATRNIAFNLQGHSKKRVKRNATIKLNTQKDAVLYFMQQIDSEMIDSILSTDFTFNYSDKATFINKLNDTFEIFQKNGDTFLSKYVGTCQRKACSFKCEGYTFIGNKSEMHFDIVLKTKNNIVTYIQDCGELKCLNTNIKNNKKKLVQLYIEPSSGIPF